ncbi:hypothetical protein ADL15_47475 [Actinoplanes awajinensis subsp. mycoplanecinus]|uniref:Uncharacterized protein n=1 Tax=Actinoplanes awajinensis subsp. mycoplanecinus TaxID=135947 RepID=A0A101J9U9_9ACTN|nr:hypothetical protein ADL15_47475 [Actinoplanes awajinensis subsp. mycoplanecinus]
MLRVGWMSRTLIRRRISLTVSSIMSGCVRRSEVRTLAVQMARTASAARARVVIRGQDQDVTEAQFAQFTAQPGVVVRGDPAGRDQCLHGGGDHVAGHSDRVVKATSCGTPACSHRSRSSV